MKTIRFKNDTEGTSERFAVCSWRRDGNRLHRTLGSSANVATLKHVTLTFAAHRELITTPQKRFSSFQNKRQEAELQFVSLHRTSEEVRERLHILFFHCGRFHSVVFRGGKPGEGSNLHPSHLHKANLSLVSPTQWKCIISCQFCRY